MRYIYSEETLDIPEGGMCAHDPAVEALKLLREKMRRKDIEEKAYRKHVLTTLSQ